MNMKKTIAAIAAGAVAVSAMATTVSALESTTLNYNLAAYLDANPAAGTAKLTANFSGIAIKPDTQIKIKVETNTTNGWSEMVTVGGRYVDTNKSIDNMYFAKDKAVQNYTLIGDQHLNKYTNGKGANGYNEITLDVKEVAAASSYELQANDNGVQVVGGTATFAVGGTSALTAADVTSVSNASFIANQMDAGTYTLTYDAAKGWTWTGMGDQAGTEFSVTVVLAAGAAAPTAGDTINVVWAPQTVDVVNLVNLTVSVDAKNLSYQKMEALNVGIANGDVYIEVVDSEGNTIKGDVKGTMSDVEKYRMPFMTNLSKNDDIIYYLETNHLTGGDNYSNTHGYRNVKAVLNDAIENYDGVTFTFNTAASGVKYVITKGATSSNNNTNVVAGPYGNDWQGDGLRRAQAQLNTYSTGYDEQYNIQAVYSSDWDAINTYTAFGEHTYDWQYAPEGTGYTGYDWGGTNLFAGALIVNERITMSLSNTEYFDWTKTSVSFDWEAIMDNAATTNNYATYIQTLKLATSNMWFWDSMDVVLTVGEADDVSADAGVTADDATLDDDDDITADDDDDVAPADDDDDDDEPAPVVDEPIVAPVATNPPTGNASVALAVIPVALAAAAIVAKKRG